MSPSTQHGFTLVELMIAMAIIGILAASAVVSYQIYSTRAQVSEGFAAAVAIKAGVAEYHAGFAELPSDIASLGYSPELALAGRSYRAIDVGSNGVITVTYRRIGDRVADGSTVVFSPDATGPVMTWTCNGGSVAPVYRPSACR
ncbi:MAG: hypothetical protein RJA99_3462 [Pseudomonadota bacterium]